MTRDDLRQRIDTIEEAYEFFLAYAAQGVSGDAASKSGGQIREYLQRMEGALDGLTDAFAAVVQNASADLGAPFGEFRDTLAADARAARAAVGIALALPAVSSQVVDNLNASIHVRALLTDLFFLDEVVKGAAG